MIPYSYNMVNMGGIDLAEANGTVVEGLYSKIVEAVNACGDVVLYNWKFAGIEIAPQHTSILVGDTIIINGTVQVTEQDVVTVPGINPDPPVLVPLDVTENGQYDPSDYDADGFNNVDVDVEYDPPTLVSLSVDSNGTYLPSQYSADGFSSVSVDVEGGGGTNITFHAGMLKVDTGVITESAEYCYSDLIPITSGTGQWFLDLDRTNSGSYYIGAAFYAEDRTTNVGYIRQYTNYRSYNASIAATAKFFRIATKFENLSFASIISLIDNIFVINPTATILINEEE